MRIYDLAKSIGKALSIEVKSSDLADEFRTLPEFEEIRDTIKSHSSSVDDKFAGIMFAIYKKRLGKGADPAPQEPKPQPAAPPEASAPKPAPKPPVRPPLPTPRRNPPPRPAPIRPGAGRPAPPKLSPLQPRTGPAPIAPRPVSPQAHAEAQGRQAPLSAIKPRPSGLATELKSTSGTTGISADPGFKPAAKVKPAAPTPSPVAPTSREDSKTVAPTSRREESKPSAAPGAQSEDIRGGQPNAPAMPKFSTDSPFISPRKPKVDRVDPRRDSRGGGGAGGDRDRRPGAGRRDDRASEPLVIDDSLALPEIGQMKASGPGRGKRKPVKAEPEAAKPKKKVMRPSKVYDGADQFRRPLKLGRKKQQGGPQQSQRREEPKPQEMGPVVITGPLTVSEFAQKIQRSAAEIIKSAFLKGKVITINQLMDLELAEEMAIEMDIDLQIRLEGDESDLEEFARIEDREEDMTARPPVVTIMGHVDHGKTTVLDYFRKSRVVQGEFGGITQHIGAYLVPTGHGDICFLDTPGHAAFTAMRGRGVQATDLVVLVVSADDGVMPQTVEAINHAKAAKVPLIVAINKIDLPGADPNRVRNELMQHSILGTNLGGDTEFVEISALKGTNMNDLLEVISLQAEVLELKANAKRPAEAVVIESNVDRLRGTVATVLVQRGTLRIGEFFVVGKQVGRVRAMLNDLGKPVKEAGPGIPVELIGVDGTPEVGELLMVMADERKAKQIAERRDHRRRLMSLGTTRHVSLEGLHDRIAEGDIKELNIILKADVQGSLEAITQALDKVGNDVIRIRVLHSGTGAITENDVSLASTSDAIIIGFNVRPDAPALDMSQHEGIEIKLYRIIYELIEDLEKALTGMLDKQYEEKAQGRVDVREVFRITKVGIVAGCYITSGEVHRGASARLVRDGVVVYQGKIASLRRHKDDVAKVAQGFECGIMLENFQDVKEGDIIESYTMQEVPVELISTRS